MRKGIALTVGLVITGLVTWRARAHPVDTYGDSGAGYIEHLERVRVLEQLVGAGGPVWDRLRAADGLYPPGLHFLSAPASFLGDHHPSSVTVLGGVWLLLLAGAVAACARTIHPRAGVPTLVATLLVPALHAVAPRYYYDLPMTALVWLAAAILAHTRVHAAGSALLAAITFAMACFIKWSALPLGLPVLLAGILLAARHTPATAARAAAGFGIWTLLLVVPGIFFSTSFGAMGGATFQPPPDVSLPEWAASLDTLRPGLGHALGSMALQTQLDGPARAEFYVRRFGTTLLAPALLPSFILVVGTWLKQRAPGLLACAAAALPVALFVWCAVPPLDERFLLTILPIISLVAGVSLASATPWSRTVGVGSAVIGLAVAIDFHTGTPHPGPPTPATTGHTVPLRWGLSTSMDRRGWARRDDLPDHKIALRTSLLEVVEACQATSITGDDALVSDKGDLNWWTFAFERAALSDHTSPRVFRALDTQMGPAPTPPTLAFIRGDEAPGPGFVPLQQPADVQAWAMPGHCPALQ